MTDLYNPKDHAETTLRMLSKEFDHYIESLITHNQTTPGILDTSLVSEMATLLQSLSKERSKVVDQISDYYQDITKDLSNKEHYERIISELSVSSKLKESLSSLLDKKAFTENQFKLVLSLIHEASLSNVSKEQDDYYQLESIHTHLLTRQGL